MQLSYQRSIIKIFIYARIFLSVLEPLEPIPSKLYFLYLIREANIYGKANNEEKKKFVCI